MTTEKLTDHANLPDDPADACRTICRTLLPLTDFDRQELPGHLAHLVNVLASVEKNDAEAWERSRHALAIFGRKAEDEAETQIEAIDRALSLARHGTGDHRHEDEPHAAGPAAIEVRTTQKVLAAYGDDDSEEAALRVLDSMEGDDTEEAS